MCEDCEVFFKDYKSLNDEELEETDDLNWCCECPCCGKKCDDCV